MKKAIEFMENKIERLKNDKHFNIAQDITITILKETIEELKNV